MVDDAPGPGDCQRWRERTHSWRRARDGGFRASRYDVAPLGEAAAKEFVVTHHYSASYPAASRRFGLFDHGELVGTAVYGIPVSAATLTNTFPGLVAYRESLELSRLVLLDEVPANAESFLVARCHALLAADGVRGVVAFSDPVARRTASGVVHPGHWGTVYQASNARFCGRSTARTLVLLPDGTVLSARSAQKVRRGERGHAHVEARLVALGAREPRGDRARWLAAALADVGATSLRHPGCLRYAFTLGTSAAQRRRVVVAPPSGPYPKSEVLLR